MLTRVSSFIWDSRFFFILIGVWKNSLTCGVMTEMRLNVMPNTRKCEGIIQNTETLWAVNKNYKTA